MLRRRRRPTRIAHVVVDPAVPPDAPLPPPTAPRPGGPNGDCGETTPPPRVAAEEAGRAPAARLAARAPDGPSRVDTAAAGTGASHGSGTLAWRLEAKTAGGAG